MRMSSSRWSGATSGPEVLDAMRGAETLFVPAAAQHEAYAIARCPRS